MFRVEEISLDPRPLLCGVRDSDRTPSFFAVTALMASKTSCTPGVGSVDKTDIVGRGGESPSFHHGPSPHPSAD